MYHPVIPTEARRTGGWLTACAVLLGALVVGVSGQPSPAQAASGGFVPVSPDRVLDTRTSSPLAPGGTLVVSFAGTVPANATAVALNLTGLRASSSTFFTVWPTGQARPPSSNVNVGPGQIRPNSVIVGLGTTQSVTIYNDQGNADALVDLMGYFTEGFTGIAPARLMDTRDGLGGPTLDAGTVRPFKVRDVGAIPANAVAVALNVTATRATADTFVTVWPEGDRPGSSNLNVRAGGTVPNLVVVGVGADDHIRLYNDQGSIELIVDVMGYFNASGGLIPQAPVRALDTRQNTCGLRLGPGETRILRLTTRTDRAAAVLNVTALGAEQPTFLTVWPTGLDRPTTSNLNVTDPDATPNLVVVGVGSAGQISIYNERGYVNVLVDVFALFDGATPGPPGAVMPCPGPPSPGTAAGLVVRPDLHRAVGVERVGVWVCDVPGGDLAITPEAVAQWANAEVAPYFAEVSNGRYTVTFTPLGRFRVSSTSPLTCMNGAEARTGAPYTNTFVTDNRGASYSGFASPGFILGGGGASPDLLARPPSQTRRSLYVGGGSTAPTKRPNPGLVIHELGHTLHWPHSYTGPAEYDNPVDLMSGWTDGGLCQGAGISWSCHAQHTLAFNRLAAGWIDDGQIARHAGGVNTVMLAPPGAGALQMVAAPHVGDDRVMLTIEARPGIGRDEFLNKEGVALHIVDQRPMVCDVWFSDTACYSLHRRQLPAVPNPYGSAHVLGVGESLAVHGLTVTVVRRVFDNYEVTLNGTFSPPGMWPYLSHLDEQPAVRFEEVGEDGSRRVVLASPAVR